MRTMSKKQTRASRVVASMLAVALAAVPAVAFGTHDRQGKWWRLHGAGALDTMEAITDFWPAEHSNGSTVILTTVNGYWDALSGAGAAGFCHGPVLMTSPEELSSQTANVLAKLAPSRIVVCGGTLSVPDSVVEQAKAATGVETTAIRLSGNDATDTAVDIYKRAESLSEGEQRPAWSTTALVATDQTYHDALAASPVAYARHMPIFLVKNGTTVTEATLDAMVEGGIKDVIIVGGKLSVTPEAVSAIEAAGITVTDRLSGDTAVETSEAIADYATANLDMSTGSVGVASTSGYWDALAGGAFCGCNDSPLVLVKDENSSTISSFVAKHADTLLVGYVFGGGLSVSQDALEALDKAAGEPQGPKLNTEYVDEQFWGPMEDNRLAVETIKEECATHNEDIRPMACIATEPDEQSATTWRAAFLSYVYENDEPVGWAITSAEKGTGEYEGEFFVSKPTMLLPGDGAIFASGGKSWDDVWQVGRASTNEVPCLEEDGFVPLFRLFNWKADDGGEITEWLCSKDNALYVRMIHTVGDVTTAISIDQEGGMLDLAEYTGMGN